MIWREKDGLVKFQAWTNGWWRCDLPRWKALMGTRFGGKIPSSILNRCSLMWLFSLLEKWLANLLQLIYFKSQEKNKKQMQPTLKMKVLVESVISDYLPPHGPYPLRLLCPWTSPGKNTGVGSHFLLQGICPTRGLNLGLLHCRQIVYHLSHQGCLQPILLSTK